MGTMQERAYWTHEVAEKLEIGESTLRKWCLALEERGHIFTKGEQDSRAFLESDIALLFIMKEWIRVRKKSMKDAAKLALEEKRTSRVHEEQAENEHGTTLVPLEQSLSIMGYVSKEEMDNALESQEKRLYAYFENRLNEMESARVKEKDQLLMASIRANQERQKEERERHEEVLRAIKEVAATKKPWWKFWK